ncbi:MAG: TetR/AcrR family transcriptional regulator [Alphaproteobacteria bacterium]
MPKGRPREFNIENALEIALRLFWQHGYEGVSIAALAEAIGIKAPSLYAAFGNKENLFWEAVRLYSDQAGHIYHESFKKKTARAVAEAILKGEVDLVTQRDKPNGCLMIQGALITSPESQKISTQMAKMIATAEGWMADRFRQAQKDGDLPKDADPQALACYIMTLNSGLAIQARNGASKKQLLKVVEIALQNWPVANEE